MSHRNARLSVHGRRLIVERHQAGWKQAHIAAAMGVSRQCVRKWIARFEVEGEVGLHDRSSRPHQMPSRTSAADEERVLEARREHRRGQDWLGPELGLAPRTVARILRRHRVPYLRECDPMTGEVIRAASKTTALRYERERPGELVHMDVKKLGRIPDGGGWRVHGRSEEVRGRGIGYDFVHSVVDDHSRLAYSEILDDEQGATCAAFFTRAAAFFAEYGVVIESLITDNALGYRRSVSMRETCAALGIKQLFIRPHCPWQNGKVERFNRTLQVEWAYRHAFTSNTARSAALAPWLEHYNTQRRHTALGGLPPISRL